MYRIIVRIIALFAKTVIKRKKYLNKMIIHLVNEIDCTFFEIF